jgi:C-terminal processing protease CtpA/Prc
MMPNLLLLTLLALIVGCGQHQPEPMIAEYYDSDGNVTAVERQGHKLSGEELKSYKSQFAGIGAVITTNELGLFVKEVPKNSPAFQAGIQPSDIIITVDGEPTAGMNLADALNALRGNPGTTVSFSVTRSGLEGELTVEVSRARFYSWREMD